MNDSKYKLTPGQLSTEYRKIVEELSGHTMNFCCSMIDKRTKDSKESDLNILMNVLTSCLFKVLYLSFPENMRGEALEVIILQIKANFKENDTMEKCSKPHTANQETKKALEDSIRGEGLTKHNSIDEMFKNLGI